MMVFFHDNFNKEYDNIFKLISYNDVEGVLELYYNKGVSYLLLHGLSYGRDNILLQIASEVRGTNIVKFILELTSGKMFYRNFMKRSAKDITNLNNNFEIVIAILERLDENENGDELESCSRIYNYIESDDNKE
ncbi:hypothetical protein M153_2640001681 [Pseudoloma neurophilia]|uniref:Uncharacterized protein n=1 Tax=Pseudoloma neurophilia TaxID=146866 RepID=A0A0R0M2Q6_9MICR|nr:hypothetical protein M153_2640001681 [Pseudoloma neurophilia]